MRQASTSSVYVKRPRQASTSSVYVTPSVVVAAAATVAILTLSHGYNAVRGHWRTGANSSGVEEYLTK